MIYDECMQNQLNKGIKWAVVTAMISGVSVFVNSLVVKGIDPLLHTTIKNAFVGLLLVGIIMLSHERQAVRRLTRQQWVKLLAIALIGGSLSFALFFSGLKLIGASEGQIVNKTLVIWVMLLAIPLLKEKVTKTMILGVIMVYLSSVLGGGWKSSEILVGHIYVLAATFLWAIETIIVKKALTDIPVTIAAGARMGIGSLILLGLLFVSGKAPLAAKLSPQQWGLLLMVGAILFSYVMSWYRALKYAPAVLVSSIMAGAVIITTLLNTLFVTHEYSGVDLAQALFIIVGCLMIMGGAKVLPPLSRMVVKDYELKKS